MGFWVIWQWNRIAVQDKGRDIEQLSDIFRAHYGDLTEQMTQNFIPSNQEGCCFDGLLLKNGLDHKGYIKSTSNKEAYSVDRSMQHVETDFGICRRSSSVLVR